MRIKNEYGKSRDKVFENLLKHGIRSTVHYKPLHSFTIFKKKAKIYDNLTKSTQLYKEIISLPFYSQILKTEQDLVIDCL